MVSEAGMFRFTIYYEYAEGNMDYLPAVGSLVL